LKVSIENEQYVVDVGYGAPSFFMPLRFVNTTPQTQMTGIYRIRKAKNVDCDYYVEKRLQKFYDMDSEYCNSVSLHFMGNCKHVFEQHWAWRFLGRFSGRTCVLSSGDGSLKCEVLVEKILFKPLNRFEKKAWD